MSSTSMSISASAPPHTLSTFDDGHLMITWGADALHLHPTDEELERLADDLYQSLAQRKAARVFGGQPSLYGCDGGDQPHEAGQ